MHLNDSRGVSVQMSTVFFNQDGFTIEKHIAVSVRIIAEVSVVWDLIVDEDCATVKRCYQVLKQILKAVISFNDILTCD